MIRDLLPALVFLAVAAAVLAIGLGFAYAVERLGWHADHDPFEEEL